MGNLNNTIFLSQNLVAVKNLSILSLFCYNTYVFEGVANAFSGVSQHTGNYTWLTIDCETHMRKHRVLVYMDLC